MKASLAACFDEGGVADGGCVCKGAYRGGVEEHGVGEDRDGQFFACAQFSGVGSNSLQVRPPSVLRFIGPHVPPCPSVHTTNIVFPSGSSTVVGWP